MEYNKDNCPCKRIKCERHGNCIECKAHHHASERKSLTSCERIDVKKSNLLK